MPYRLSSDDNTRLVSLSHWLKLPKDYLFSKLIKFSLTELESVRDSVDFCQDLNEKYKLAEKYRLLDD